MVLCVAICQDISTDLLVYYSLQLSGQGSMDALVTVGIGYIGYEGYMGDMGYYDTRMATNA